MHILTQWNVDGRRVRSSTRARFAGLVVALLVATSAGLGAQVRERPIPFDSAGRVMFITPPLAARLGLSAPIWPVSGDYFDARLYTVSETTEDAVLVVRRQREVLERYPVSAAQRRELAAAVARGAAVARSRGDADTMPSLISDRVQGAFVVNQSLLGLLLFAPATSVMIDEVAAGGAAYLAVAGGTFFLAANHVKRTAVSRAQNHLAWHGARQGAGAAYLASYAIGGDSVSERAFAAALLAGGVVGDILGYRLARPMTDAEAHGVSHGATFSAALTAGLLGTTGLWDNESSSRTGAAIVLGAQAIGYPLGMRYARNASYRVTAGDVGTLLVGEALGVAAAATLIPDSGTSDEVGGGLVTAGLLLGAVAGDRLLARRFDYTEPESRLLQLGTLAGGVVGLAIPALAASNSEQLLFGAAAVGGLVGAFVTHGMLAPARAAARGAEPRRTGMRTRPSRFDVRITPQNLLLARSGNRGVYPLVDVAF